MNVARPAPGACMPGPGSHKAPSRPPSCMVSRGLKDGAQGMPEVQGLPSLPGGPTSRCAAQLTVTKGVDLGV